MFSIRFPRSNQPRHQRNFERTIFFYIFFEAKVVYVRASRRCMAASLEAVGAKGAAVRSRRILLPGDTPLHRSAAPRQ